MKKIIQTLVIALLFMVPVVLSAQPSPHDTGVGGGTGQEPTGGGGSAPIGSGVVILLALGAAYAGKKLYNVNAEDIK